MCSIYVLVFIVGLSGFWIVLKPYVTFGFILGIGFDSSNTLRTTSGVLLMVVYGVLGSVSGGKFS